MSDLRPNKRPRREFFHLRSLRGLSRQEKCDFSYNDMNRYFRVMLWDKSHICRFDECPYPGKIIATFEESSLDHIVPRSLGGRTRLVNVQLMHQDCNRKKGAKMPTYYHPKAFTAAKSRSHGITKREMKLRGMI